MGESTFHIFDDCSFADDAAIVTSTREDLQHCDSLQPKLLLSQRSSF